MPEKDKQEKKEKKDKEEKDKKEKKEKTEDKEKKEKKEKKADKEEKEEKKEKKPERRLGSAGGGGFDLWGDVAETTSSNPYSDVKAPQDKRVKEEKKKAEIANRGDQLKSQNDNINDILKAQTAAKKAEKEKAEQEAKAKKKEQARSQEFRDEQEEGYQIMDKSGAGNFMDKREVQDIMKSTVAEASSSAGRCQIAARTVIGDKVFTDNTKIVFDSLGDMKAVKGMVYIRGGKEATGCTMRLTRPATVYVCLSKPANEEDTFLRTWEVIDDMALPEFQGGSLAEVVEVKRKVFRDSEQRSVAVPRPPAGLETCLVFVLPDFHADPFPETEMETEEERLAREREEARERRSGKAASSSSAAKDAEPSAAEKLEAVLAKVERGEKLTNKEKRIHDKHLEAAPVYKPDADELVSPLGCFAISLPGGKNEPPAAADSFVCDGFTLSAPGQTLFDNASITIAQKHRYGILGPNGQGKTTLLRHIAAREMPVPLNWDVILVEQEAKASDRSAVEEVIAADTKTADLLVRESELLKKLEEYEEKAQGGEEVSMEELEKTRSDLETVAADLDACGAESAEAKVRKILCGLGFTNGKPDEDRFSMDRPVIQFSGGWRMRISLAKALFLEPWLLMLDEPTNHLDLDAVLWLDDYLSEKYPHSVIVVSHDADFLDSICTDILHLEDKKLVHYRGDYTAFKKMHAQKQQGLDREFKKQQDALKALKKKGMNKDDAEKKVKEQFGVQALDNLMEKRKDYIVNFYFEGHGMDRTLGLNVSEVAFSYNGKEPWLLDECEIGVDCGSRIAIVGPNGAGKSTLLNIMMETLEPCQGSVRTSKGIRVKQYHQHFEELLPLDKTGIEYLVSDFNLSPPEKARACLGRFGLPGTSHHTKIGNLSGGQKARVAFAALMLHKPHIIVLDEPTNHLDIESVEALTDAVSNFNGGLVIVSHDARLIQAIDCAIWVVDEGTCYEFEKGFEGYRDKVLADLEKRQEEVDRMEEKRRKERAQRREKAGVDKAKIEAKKAAKNDEAKAAEKKAEEDAAEEERQKAAAEEEAKRKAAEEEAEAKRKAAEEADAAKKAEEEAAKKAEEEEANRKNAAEEAEAQRKANEEAAKQKDAEEKKRAEEAKKKAEEAKQKEAEEEAAQKKADEEAAQKKAEEEAAQKKAEEEAAQKEADEEAAQKKAEEKPEEEAEEADDEDVDAKHDEYIIAEVTTIRAIKKKKGFFLCEVEVGADDAVPVVTNLKNVMAGNKVIFAAEGSTVCGKVVEAEHVHGEYSRGQICGPAEMGWKGDATECITLIDDCEVGDPAPASKKSPLVEGNEEKDEEEGEEAPEAEEEAEAAEEPKAKKGKDAAEAKGKKGKPGKAIDEDEEEEDNKKASGKKAAPKAKGKKARGDEDDEDEEVDRAAGKKKAAAKAKGKNDDDEDEDDEDDKKRGKKKAAPKTKGRKARGDDDDEDDDEEEDDRKGKKKPAPKAKGKKGRKDDDDEDDEEEADTKKGGKKSAPKAKGKKARRDEDDDDDEEEDDDDKKASGKKPAPKAKGKKGKKDEDEDDAEEEDEDDKKASGKKATPKPKGKAAPKAKGKKKDEEEEEDEDEAPKGAPAAAAAAPAAPSGGDGRKHSEYKVAKVLSADSMKKKKGSLLVELQVGDETVTVVTSLQNVEAGQLVILAPEGSTVCGKEVKRSKVAGEWSAGTICGPMEMGCPGDASLAIVLDDSHQAGDFAPALDGGGGDGGGEDSAAVGGQAPEEGGGDEAKRKGKEPAKAKGKKAKDESDDEEDGEEKEEEAPAGKAKKGKEAKAAAKADDDDSDWDDRGKKGKKGKRK